MLDPPKKPETFIIPPDPAVVEGIVAPGEKLFVDSKMPSGHSAKHSKTIPLDKAEVKAETPPAPTMPHTSSVPSRFPPISQPHPLSPLSHPIGSPQQRPNPTF